MTWGNWLKRDKRVRGRAPRRWTTSAILILGASVPSVSLGDTISVSLGPPVAMHGAGVAVGPFISGAPDATTQATVTPASWTDHPGAISTPPAGAVPTDQEPLPAPGLEVFPPLENITGAAHPSFGLPNTAGLFDNLSLFFGLDGSKGPEDLGINANFGYRGAINWGVPLWERHGLGVQVGTALNVADNAVRVLRSVDGTRDRLQSFTTVGVFQRTDFGLNWGIGYDFLAEDYYKSLVLGQWRGQIGHSIGSNDEVGVWATVRNFGDSATVARQSFNLKPITQGNLYWRHVWGNETSTRFWVGLAEEHGRFLLGTPGNSAVHHPVVFGADLYVPLTDRLALFGEANFITPNDTGTVTATMGIAFFPGGRAKTASRNRFAPLLPVANNSTFGVDLQR